MADYTQLWQEQDAPMEPPTGYVPNYGFRDFDQAKVHRNGTYFDDGGYDIYFCDREGRLRPDKTPPFRGVYMLGIFAAVQTALDIADNLTDAETYRDKDKDYYVPDSCNLSVETEAEYECEHSFYVYFDHNFDGNKLSDVPACLWTYDVTHGKFLIVDPEGTMGVVDPRPASIWEYVFWDEETGDVLMDQSDFLVALSQIGTRLLKDSEGWACEFGQDMCCDCLVRAAKMLQEPSLWSGVSPMRWAERGLKRQLGARQLRSWDDTVCELMESVESRDEPQRDQSHPVDLCDGVFDTESVDSRSEPRRDQSHSEDSCGVVSWYYCNDDYDEDIPF